MIVLTGACNLNIINIADYVGDTLQYCIRELLEQGQSGGDTKQQAVVPVESPMHIIVTYFV